VVALTEDDRDALLVSNHDCDHGAGGSNFESQTQLIIAEGLNFGSAEMLKRAESLIEEVSRMLVAMITTLRR